ASALGEMKAKAVLATGAEVLATGNIGCLTQLRTHFDKLGSNLPVRHTIQVLRDAYNARPGQV
ncbi:MAG: (Fe-S)-binding protein, partial [Verrucomicrobia bacterium]|nr:(Fe-S)-binding protein [Verrucomicrobiota bacterium]